MKKIILFAVPLLSILIIDQAIKWFFVLNNYSYDGSIISLVLVYNKGVAFSMFAFLDEWLKYIQILLITIIGIYFWKNINDFDDYIIPVGVIYGAGISNIVDRFIHEGVVDYIFWHYKIEFAIFNFADVSINIGVLYIILLTLLKKKQKS